LPCRSLLLCSLMLLPPPPSPLFPYTTLFRSPLDGGRVAVGLLPPPLAAPLARLEPFGMLILIGILIVLPLAGSQFGLNLDVISRSEEHTSELQSPYDLVCRLLLEKKKTIQRC